HTRWPRDWSSDVCSSDLAGQGDEAVAAGADCFDHTRQRLRVDRAAVARGTEVHQHDLARHEIVQNTAPRTRDALEPKAHPAPGKIGRASCRERGEAPGGD